MNREIKENIYTNKHILKLNDDIEEFKRKFKSKLNVKYDLYKHQMVKIFGHSDIDGCSLKDLLKLGFNSKNMWREDLEK